MPTLPALNSSLLVRTDFTSDDAWQQVSDEAQEANENGFRAYIEPVSDPAFDRATWQVVKAAVPDNDHGACVVFIADSTALTSRDHRILVVDLRNSGNPPFRCIPSELWSVDNNLNIANMVWEDFTSELDGSGVFRGFSEQPEVQDYPPPPSAGEIAAAQQRALAEQQRQAEEARQRQEERDWNGRLPGERLRRLRGNALSMAKLDRPLVEALAEIDTDTQRQVARWATRRAFAEAQLAGIDWIAAALAAMDQGEPLPPPFGTNRRAWDLLFADERIPRTTVTSPDGIQDNYSQQAMAFPAIFSAREEDALRAAVDALWSAAVAFGHTGRQVLFDEVRQAFPALANTP